MWRWTGTGSKTVTRQPSASEYSVNLGTSANMLSYYDLGASLDSVTVESLHLATNLVTAAAECRNYGNRTQCEHVANLCVLTMYDTGAAACKLHAGLRASHPDLTPRLFYDAGVDYAGKQFPICQSLIHQPSIELKQSPFTTNWQTKVLLMLTVQYQACLFEPPMAQ